MVNHAIVSIKIHNFESLMFLSNLAEVKGRWGEGGGMGQFRSSR